MNELLNPVALSRLQFAFTAMFHILWPVLIVGLSLFLVFLESMWLITNQVRYYHHLRFWMKLFLLNLAVGVATGFPLEFQFGTNWSVFSKSGGTFVGHILGFEAAIAFMLEATFLAIMAFGWNRVPRGMHLFATIMVAVGASLSVFWIMVANSWMQLPSGGYFEEGRFIITSQWKAVFNPNMIWGVSHMWAACIMITVFVTGGLSAWYILKQRHAEFFIKTFKISVAAAIVITPLQIYLGDGSGRWVFEHQPTKLAAMEAHWETNPTGQGAPWHILAWPDTSAETNRFAVDIPYALSLITTHSFTGKVTGLKVFPRENRPPVWISFITFRIMIAVGFLSFFLMLYTVWVWLREGLTADQMRGRKKLLCAWIIAAPLNFLAMEAGWATREVGRQPWVIYDVLRTSDSVSPVSTGMVGSSFLVFAVIYTMLFILYLIFGTYLISKGPEFEDPPAMK